MAERPQDDFDKEPQEVDTHRAIQQGLGVGARELAAIGESGEKGTLEGPQSGQKTGQKTSKKTGQTDKSGTIESATGRSASVLDRKPHKRG